MNLLLVSLFFLILKKLLAPLPYFKYKKQQSGVSGVSIVQSGLRARKTGSGGMGGTTLQVLMLLCIASENTKGPAHHPELHSGKQMLKPSDGKVSS